MTAYASAEQLLPEVQLRPLDRVPGAEAQVTRMARPIDEVVLEGLLGRLADLVADRLAERITAAANEPTEQWMDARAAAEYLGIHRDTLRKLAGERAVPVQQDGPGCKLYVHRDDLDEWRRTSRAGRSWLRAVS